MAAASKFGFLLRPKWLGFHLLCACAVVGMIFAGMWQLQRLDQRRDANAEFIERIEQAPVPLESLLADDLDPDVVANRRVTASGTYLPDQVVLFNRSQGGRAVDNVLTPLVIDDGRVLIVNRGAIPVEGQAPSPPAVAVTIEGRLRPSEVRQRGELSDANTEVIAQTRRVDLERLAPQFGGDLVPLYVELVSSEPAAGPADPALLDTPVLGEGNHLSYAFQWFIFSACVAAGWVLAIRRSLRTRAPNP
ncbi:MAG: SURF1 family protein [Ilumatobacter sp.]|jgi:surfeit locus 1 family protein|uniref:SURF1 family protein n=1 Tax=Ilumatobacter sp. TaxID=1967498 RepID=UPI002A315452|nr:SURF1 family protein [Ilumatobacter sp.]MBT5552433.1 SURF1 family protein [Ilumatobacter sp.]MDG0975701.1 SURF1 family protein [Ilumatobacter sp.]MDG1786293.1 SURF1 family protein [Ilumatobacter sp.]